MQDENEFTAAYGGDSIQKDLPAAGAHQAVCCQVHALGHQMFQGQVSINPKCAFIFELDEKMKGGDLAGKPFAISQKFALYMGKKGKPSNLRRFLEMWKGRPLTEEEAAKTNVKAIEGAGCTLIIAHKPKTDGSGHLRAEIVGISRRNPQAPAVARTYLDAPEWVLKEKAQAVPPPGKPQQQAAPTAGIQAPQQEDDLPF